MSQTSKMLIKIVGILIVFLPYKFLIMAGKPSSFVQDFLVALGGYMLGYAVIALLDRGRPDGQ